MALGDPFNTTYQGSMQAGESLGQGIQSAAGSVSDAMKQKQQQAQMQKMMGLIGMGKKAGAIQDSTEPVSPDEYNAQAEAMIQKAGSSIFKNNTTLTGSTDPNERMQQYQTLFKSAGIPGPKTTKTTTTLYADKLDQAQKMGWSWNAKDGVTFHSAEVSPEAQAMQSLAMDSKKQSMEKSQQDEFDSVEKMINPTVAPTRSPLGVLGNTAVRADRALKILNDPTIIPSSQVLSAANSDLTGMLAGGAPTVVAMGEQNYKTLASVTANIEQFAQSTPEDASRPAILKQIKNELQSLKDVGSAYVKNNLEVNDTSPYARDNPDTYKAARKKVVDMFIKYLPDTEDDDGNDTGTSNGAQSVLSAAGMTNSNDPFGLKK